MEHETLTIIPVFELNTSLYSIIFPSVFFSVSDFFPGTSLYVYGGISQSSAQLIDLFTDSEICV